VENVLTDAGIWYALFDPRDQYYAQAQEKAQYLDLFHIVLPWPILYETLRTRLVRNVASLRSFEAYLSRPHITYLEDASYRNAALELSMDSSLNRARPLSLVDCVLRLMLEDVNMKIDYLITFNVGDFSDVCRTRGIEII
jgi:predicted nucleic acid-binding protein